MITQISYNLDLYNINTEITTSDIENLVIPDNDILEFTYKGIQFYMQISDIRISDKKHYVEDFNRCAEAIRVCSGMLPKTDEDLEFYWSEITYNPTRHDAIQLICMFRTLWFFHSKIIESDEKSITFYAHKEGEEIIYSLQDPEQEAQKVKLCFNKNAFRIFEGLENVKINFVASYGYTYASLESENVFLADQQKEVCKYLELIKLTPTTEGNYELFFDIDFSCTVKDGIATFQIGNFTFEYEY